MIEEEEFNDINIEKYDDDDINKELKDEMKRSGIEFKQPEKNTDINPNPYDLRVGDIITAYQTGIYVILELNKINRYYTKVLINQLYSFEGTELNMMRPVECNIRYCKPAILYIKELETRIKKELNLLDYLKSLSIF